jgi:hypothetical protein
MRTSPAQSPKGLSNSALTTIALFLFAAAFVQFFGSAIWSGWRLLAGDAGDDGLIAYTHEHVFLAMSGRASLLNPQFYFPTRGVLGYTDAFLLNQIFYAPLRLMGVEQLLAMQLTFMLLSLTGGAFFAALLVRFFGVRLWLAVIAAALFAFAHNLYLKSIHPQHFAIYYLPIASYLVFASLFVTRSVFTGAALAFAGGLLLGFTFLTGFYMAWFFLFFLMFALPVFAAIRWGHVVHFARTNLKGVLFAFAGAVSGFGLGAIGVALVHLPVMSALQWMTRRNFLMSPATFRDIINVSDSNLMWGWLLRHSGVIPQHRLQYPEFHVAVTPLLVTVTAVGTFLSARAARRSDYQHFAAAIGSAVFVGFIAMYVLTISIRGEWSPFFLVQEVVPGAVGIRVGFRSQVISGMFIAVAFSVVAEAFLRGRSAEKSSTEEGRRIRALEPAVLLVGTLLLLEQVNLASMSSFDRIKEQALLASVPAPPSGCRSLAAVLVDAMRISQKFGVPTVNGYSGGAPPGWTLNGVWEGDYVDRVKQWVRVKDIAGPLCLYVEPTKTWSFMDLSR